MTHPTTPEAERERVTMREGIHMLRLALVQAECAIKGREHTGFINKVLNATSHLMDPLHADRAPASPNTGAVPDGFKLVPIEPTDEMVNAPNTIIQAYGARLIYQRMLNASPAAPSPIKGGEAPKQPPATEMTNPDPPPLDPPPATDLNLDTRGPQ